MTAASTRAFGAGLLMLVDALFFGAMLYIYAYSRSAHGAWPTERLSAMLPLLAAGSLVLAALLHRAHYALLFPFFGTAATLVLIVFLLDGAAAAGITPRASTYGFVVYGLTAFWALHLVGVLIALGVQIRRKRTAEQTPLLGRFLLFQAAVGAVLVTMVFLW